MKNCWLMTMISVSVLYTLSSEPCQWNQYLGNPGRTGYTNCNGPDSPEILWEIILKGEIGDPFIAEDMVVVPCILCKSGCYLGSIPSYETTVVVIDLLTGTLLQKAVVEGSLTGAYPLGNNVILGESYEKLYEIDLLSGEALPVSTIPGKSVLSCYPHPYPIILPDKIVFPTTPIVCISRVNYSTLWDLQSSLGKLYPEDGEILSIAASMDSVYVILKDEEERIWAVDSRTGKLIWVESINAWEIVTEGSVLFAGGCDLYALDAETGELLWTYPCETDFIHSNIVIGPDAVYFTDNQKLYAVDKNTGTLKWKTKWKGIPFWSTDIIGAGNTVICSDILNISSFSAKDGTLLWNVHFQDLVEHDWEKPCPAVADGIIVVGGKESSNNLIALASNPYLFVKQGDAFLEKGKSEKALSSYKKAQELYEKKGSPKAQEIQKKIQEIEKSPSAPEQSEPPPEQSEPPPESPISPSPVQSNPLILLSVVVGGVLAGVLVTYYLLVAKIRNK